MNFLQKISRKSLRRTRSPQYARKAAPQRSRAELLSPLSFLRISFALRCVFPSCPQAFVLCASNISSVPHILVLCASNFRCTSELSFVQLPLYLELPMYFERSFVGPLWFSAAKGSLRPRGAHSAPFLLFFFCKPSLPNSFLQIHRKIVEQCRFMEKLLKTFQSVGNGRTAFENSGFGQEIGFARTAERRMNFFRKSACFILTGKRKICYNTDNAGIA